MNFVFLNFYLSFESAPGSPISNYYANTTGASRSFRTLVGQVIYHCCNCAEHFACLCRANLVPVKTKKHFAHTQPHAGGCGNQSLVIETMTHCNICSHNMHPIITPGILISDRERPQERLFGGTITHRITFIPDTHGKHPPDFKNLRNDKYQARRSNISSQPRNYSNVIQNNALQEQQCFAPGKLDNKTISILIDTCLSICLLDEQLYYSLPSIPQLQPIQFPI